MVCTVYLIIRLEYIYKHLLSQNKINENIAMFNSKTSQIHREIKIIKSKSFDTADTNFVLQQRSEQVTNEIELLKYKQKCCHDEIQRLKELYHKISQ
jgi:hypothetical protein